MKTEKQITKQTNETESKRCPTKVHIFDDVFRTMCEKMPKLLIPLINEAFGTSYSDDETLVQLRNERHLEDRKIVTDALVKICGHLYHIECQSTDSAHMILRMFEYDASIAIEHWAEIPDGFEVAFPRSCVVYLRGEGKVNRNKKLRIKFPDGKSYTYCIYRPDRARCTVNQSRPSALLVHSFRSVEQSAPEKRLSSFPETNALLLYITDDSGGTSIPCSFKVA